MADEQIVTSIVAKADLSSLVSEVHRATASLQQLQRELLTSNKSIASATKVAQNAFRDTLIKSGMYSSHFVNLQSDVDQFGKNLDAGRLKLKDYFQTFRTHVTSTGGMIRQLAKEQVMLQNAVLQPLGRNAQGLMQYNVMIPRGLDAVRSKMQLANMEAMVMNKALSQGATSLINWGKNTQWAGRQLTVGLTVPLAMFGSTAAKAFREADQELTRLVKVYGDISGAAATDLEKIRKDVTQTAKEISSAMGVSFTETIGLAADIAATGQQGEQLLGSLKETTRLAVLGEVDRAEAMKATLAIQTAFKSNTQELTDSINFLNAVENQTSTTLNDLVEAIPKAGTVVKQLGGDVQDLALYLTAMREGGVNASEAANALKSGLASMINPTKQTIGVMSDFGIDIMGMVQKNTGNTTGMIMDLQRALDGLDPLSKARALEQMFGKFQFARMAALFNNLGKEGSQTLQVMELMNASTSQLAKIADRELKLVTESASGKYRRAIEGLKATLADVGEEFLGVATKFINAFTKVLDFFTNLPDPIKKAVTYLGGFTAVIGPIIMLTGVLANFFGYITKGVVSLRAFFQGQRGWKMLTPEMIAAEKAAQMVEKSFYSDAAAAEVLHGALTKLVTDYRTLQQAMVGGVIPLNPTVTTPMGNPIMGRRSVDPTNVYAGAQDTRAMSHILPRDPSRPASIFGGVPGAIPVNQAIGRNPQMYMDDTLPHIEGLTSIKGVSTGIVSGEAARFHALMATLGMQTQAEVTALKKTIALGGTVSSQLLDTFDDILPITQRLSQNAATESAAIVAELRAGKMTVDQAKARIIAVNAELEAALMSEVGAYASSRGRTIDFYKAPLMNQPVVDAQGHFTLRDLYKKDSNKAVMEEFGRLRGVRTFGAPYSIHTTRIPRFNSGGGVESFGPNKTQVSGPASINYDDRLGSVPVGGYVLNQSASMNPANQDLVAMAKYTYEDGGKIEAALTPKETVYGPGIHKIPGLYEAVDAANNGYNFGGQIIRNIKTYGMPFWSAFSRLNMINRRYMSAKTSSGDLNAATGQLGWGAEYRARSIMHDATILSERGMPRQLALARATKDFDDAVSATTYTSGPYIGSINNKLWQQKRLEQFKSLDQELGGRMQYAGRAAVLPNQKTIQFLLDNAESLGGKAHITRIFKSLGILDNKGNINLSGLGQRMVTEHTLPYSSWGYSARGNYGQAMWGEFNINEASNQLRRLLQFRKNEVPESLRGFSLYPDQLIKSDRGLDIYNRSLMRSLGFSMQELNALQSMGITSLPQIFRQIVQPGKKYLQGVGGTRNVRTLFPALAANYGGPIGRSKRNYGNPINLINANSMLKILKQARQMSSKEALGSFAKTPVSEYSHQIAPSTGKSFPIPGVSGLYKNDKGELVFFKGMPNEISAKAEMYGTRMAREVFGLDSPTQTIRTIRNPLDPSGKTKLLGLESPFNPIYSAGGTKFTEDQMIRQTIASLIMGNKDLSKSNVFGNVLADVGPAGVFSRASMNTAHSTSMHSMEQQALINLLGVRGGARKDFAYSTAPVAGKMTPRQYGSRMKSTMKSMRPKLLKFIESLPEGDRAPYIALLQRFDEGMNVNWSKYHSLHSAPKYNRGGGVVRRGRSNYGTVMGPTPEGPARKVTTPRRVPLLGTRVDHELAALRAWVQANMGPRLQSTFAPMSVEKIGYSGYSKKGGTVRGNAVMPVWNPGSLEMVNALKVGNMFGGVTSLVDRLVTRLEKPFAKLVTAITTQTKIIEQKPAFKMTLSGTAESKIRENIPKGPTWKQKFWSGFNDAGYLTGLKNQPNAVDPVTGRPIFNQFAIGAGAIGEANTLNPFRGMTGTSRIAMGKIAGSWRSSGMLSQTGQEIEERKKAGYLGFRGKEYRVGDQVYTRAQARQMGLVQPGFMGQGGAMGVGMLGSFGGMALMSKQEKTLGMNSQALGIGVMAASNILPFMMMGGKSSVIGRAAMGAKGWVGDIGKILQGNKTAIQSTGRLATSLKSASGAGQALWRVLNIAKFAAPITLVVTAIQALGYAWKKTNDWHQDAILRFGMSKKGAEQAGIEYFNLSERMKAVLSQQKAMKATALASKVGVPGLMMTQKESLENVEFAKKNLGEFIETVNRSSEADLSQLAVNMKAQFVGAGMSIEDANKKILGIIGASEKANMAFQVFSNQGFASITNRATAAKAVFENLANEINNPGDQFGTKMIEGFSSLLNISDQAINSLVGTTDATGKLIDEAEAFKQVYGNMKSNKAFNQQIGEGAYVELPSELQDILNYTDTIGGSIAKWRLFLKGVDVDLKKISSASAIALEQMSAALDSAMTGLSKSMDTSTTFGRFGKAIDTLTKQQNKLSIASQKASLAAQKNSQEELKLIQKKIKAIEDEANAKIKALNATRERENYQLELQKLQIEYQDAIARGDMTAAARAQLDIQQLTKDRQAQLAEDAIRDAADKAKKPLEVKAEAINNRESNRQYSNQLDNLNASQAGQDTTKLTELQNKYNDFVARKAMIGASDYNGQTAFNNEFAAFVAQVQKDYGYKKGKDTQLAKTVREDIFKEFFTDKGTAKTAPVAPANTPSHLQDLSTMSFNVGMQSQLNKDVASATQQANLIVKGLGGNKTLAQVIEAINNQKGGIGNNNPTAGPLGGSSSSAKNMVYTALIKSFFSNPQFAPGALALKNYLPGVKDNKNLKWYNPLTWVNPFGKNAGGPIFNPRYNMGGAVSMPRYNVGGPVRYAGGGMVTPNRRNYGNAMYNINVELNGSNLDANDVARAIRKEMEIREMAAGPGRRY